jgi:Fe2+ or Zn2+ uptake regulation protein
MRNTRQQNEVLRAVQASCDHPSAEKIYERVRAVMPNISLGTVYHNLKRLTELGLIKPVTVQNRAERFDKTLTNHAHFHCSVCGEVTDVDAGGLESLILQAGALSGNVAEGVEIMLYGRCKTCKNKEIN